MRNNILVLNIVPLVAIITENSGYPHHAQPSRWSIRFNLRNDILYGQHVTGKNVVPIIFLQSSQVPAWQVSPFLASLNKVYAGTRVVHRIHAFKVVIIL